MPYSDYPGSVYPPFAHGPGYILSRALLKVIMKDYKEGQVRFELQSVLTNVNIFSMLIPLFS
jgi:hypothetical protein